MSQNHKPNFVLENEWPTCGTCIYFHEDTRPEAERIAFRAPDGYCGFEAPRETNNGVTNHDNWCGQWVYIGKLKDEHNRVIINAVQFSQQVWKHRANQIKLMNERAQSGVH